MTKIRQYWPLARGQMNSGVVGACISLAGASARAGRGFLSRLPSNDLFNFGGVLWQELMERFQFLGFDEIHYELEVVK